MAVIIGSARSDERGSITGGKAGDQTGREVSTQNWYKHKKKWRVLRCVIPEMRPLIAQFMRDACDNDNVGYDQYQRSKKGSLRRLLAEFKYIIKAVTTKCETDCSALVNDCVTCALRAVGRNDVIPDFNTSNEVKTLLNTGLFVEMEGTKYTDSSDYLMAGDILCTKTKGHTVIVLTNGSKAGEEAPAVKAYTLGDRTLKSGASGPDVKELQNYLIKLGYDLGKYGADGDFGSATKKAVLKFQSDNKLAADGVVGPATVAAIKKVIGNNKSVKISGGNCWARTAPGTSGTKIGVVYKGDVLPYKGQTADNGWHLVEFEGKEAWVSGKYGKIVNK